MSPFEIVLAVYLAVALFTAVWSYRKTKRIEEVDVERITAPQGRLLIGHYDHRVRVRPSIRAFMSGVIGLLWPLAWGTRLVTFAMRRKN